jgi:O-antigen/teichoic acid export membrane protein
MIITKKSFIFIFSNVCAKGLAAFVQLYCIFVVTNMQSKDDSAILFLLLGYAIWFQMFEFGLAQTLQNKFNSKNIYSRDVIKTILLHYLLLLLIALFIVFTPFLTNLLLGKSLRASDEIAIHSFSIGAGILVLASSNVVTQRFLLVINKGFFGNILLLSQALLSIIGLTLYWFFGNPNLTTAVVVYLGPQILVFIPVLIGFLSKLRKSCIKKTNIPISRIFYDSLGFCGIGLMSAIFLGSDYFFAAHYLNSSDVISYYLVTRIFFISFVIYYAHLLHRVKRLSTLDLLKNPSGLLSTIKDSLLVGVISVLVIYILSAILEIFGLLGYMTNGIGVSQFLLFCGFLYFLTRVFRDVSVVIISSINNKRLLYKIYLIEIFTAVLLMFILVPKFAGIGIFISMMAACLLSLIFSLFSSRKIIFLFGVPQS